MTVRRWAWSVAAALALGACSSGDDDSGGAAPDGPAASSTTAPGDTRAPSTGPGEGIWPFTSEAEAVAAPSDSPYRDAEFSARAFAREYLGITQPLAATSVPAGDRFTVSLRHTTGEGGAPWPDAPLLTEVLLSRYPSTAPWTVVGARAPRISLRDHLEGIRPSSPLALRGWANTHEGTVHVEVREDGMLAGEALGRTFVTGSGASDGSTGPFEGEVEFRPPTRDGGALILLEGNEATGGGALQVLVQRLVFDRP